MTDFPYNYHQLPLLEDLREYIGTGKPQGDFLTAVLENDLGKACRHADYLNLHMIPVYYSYIFNHAPTSCYGSPDAVTHWIEIGGMVGLNGE